MKRSDIADEHVLDLAHRWYDAPLTQPGVLDALIAEGIPPKLAAAKIEHLCRRGLLDHGVSPRFPWPR